MKLMGNYKKLDDKDIAFIKNVIGDEERVLVGENINEEYSHDELGGTSSYPDIVIKAKSAEEISAIMKYAYEQTIPVTPRGSGTGLVGSSVAIEHDFFYPSDSGEKSATIGGNVSTNAGGMRAVKYGVTIF